MGGPFSTLSRDDVWNNTNVKAAWFKIKADATKRAQMHLKRNFLARTAGEETRPDHRRPPSLPGRPYLDLLRRCQRWQNRTV
jgi:hypothetical protein